MSVNIERTIDWAVKVFRPVLKELHIGQLSSKPYNYVLGGDYPALIRENMANCLLIVQKCKFLNPSNAGLFIWRYKESKKSYVLYILLSEKLFEQNTLPVIRKNISTHEFVHCIAAMMTFSRLQTVLLIRNLQNKLAKRFHCSEQFDGVNILNNLRNSFKENEPEPKIFDDAHFRTGDEDFQPLYSDLYKNLLLSYDLFCEKGFFDDTQKKKYYKYQKENNLEAMVKMLKELIKSLSEKKALDINFIIARIEEFYPKIEDDLKRIANT